MKRINWRYAIGELLIVVTGITIAFALNNWALNLNNEEQETTYLQNIKIDLEHDIRHLDSNVREMERRIAYLQNLMPHLQAELPGRDSIAPGIFKVADPVGFTPKDATIQSLQFSGDLKLIGDIQLKNSIMNHYSKYKKVNVEHERHVHFAKSYLADYFIKDIDYAAINRKEGYSFLNDSYFHNIVYSLYGIYKIEMKAQQEALLSAVKLKDKL